MLYILSITVWRSLIVTLLLPGLRTPRLTKWWTRDLILHNCCGKFLVSAKTVSRGRVLYCHWGSPAGRKKMIFFEFVQQNTREWGGATQIYHLAGEFYITTLVMSRPGVTRVRGLLLVRREMKSLPSLEIRMELQCSACSSVQPEFHLKWCLPRYSSPHFQTMLKHSSLFFSWVYLPITQELKLHIYSQPWSNVAELSISSFISNYILT